MDDQTELWLRELYAQVRAIRLMIATGFFLTVFLVVSLLVFGGF